MITNTAKDVLVDPWSRNQGVGIHFEDGVEVIAGQGVPIPTLERSNEMIDSVSVPVPKEVDLAITGKPTPGSELATIVYHDDSVRLAQKQPGRIQNLESPEALSWTHRHDQHQRNGNANGTEVRQTTAC
jgi:hypothetical protein